MAEHKWSWSKYPEENGEESKARIKRVFQAAFRVLVFFPVTTGNSISSLNMEEMGEVKS